MFTLLQTLPEFAAQSAKSMPFLPSSPTRLNFSHRIKPPTSFLGKVSTIDTSKIETAPTKRLRQKLSPNGTHEKMPQDESMQAVNNLESNDKGPETHIRSLVDSDSRHTNRDSTASEVVYRPEVISNVPFNAAATTSDSLSVEADAASESEYSLEEDSQPVVGRASSVRVGKPQVVQQKPKRNSKHPGASAGHSRSDSRSSLKAERVLENRSEMLPVMPEEPTQHIVEEDASPAATRGFRQAEELGSRRRSSSTIVSSISRSKSSRKASIESAADQSSGQLTGNTLRSVHPTIVDPDTPNAPEADNRQTSEASSVRLINRAMSAPLPLPKSGLSRRVTIRPSDLNTKDHHEHTSFRESVVATPYPPRGSIQGRSTRFEENEDQSSNSSTSEKEKNKEKQKVSFSNLPGEKDRFPSPEHSEVLFLDLSLLNHRCACTTLEIHIADKGTFDDEMLFEQIRAAYTKQLLGTRRLLLSLVRRVDYATVAGPANHDSSDFDNIDFIRHFQKSSLGHKRKAWVIWLRNNNSRLAMATTASTLTAPARVYTNLSSASGQPIRETNNLNSLSLRTHTPGHGRRNSRTGTTTIKSFHTERDINKTDPNKRFSTASDAGSFDFVYSPAVPRLPFLSALQEAAAVQAASPTAATAGLSGSPCRSFFWPSNASSSPETHGTSDSARESESQAVRIPTIFFHHEFRAVMIVLLTLLNIVAALFAVVLWVVFGVPGSRPGMERAEGIYGNSAVVGIHGEKLVLSGEEMGGMSEGWEGAAKGRVLTGVVVGLVVLIVGGILEGGLVWGGYLLL